MASLQLWIGLSLEFEWQQVSLTPQTLLSILPDLSNAVWMVSARLLISKSSSLFNNPSVTVPRAPITISIAVIFIFHSFFSILIRDIYPSFHFPSILLRGQPGQHSPQFCKFSFFLLIIIRSGRQSEIRWSVCISKSKKTLSSLFHN